MNDSSVSRALLAQLAAERAARQAQTGQERARVPKKKSRRRNRGNNLTTPGSIFDSVPNPGSIFNNNNNLGGQPHQPYSYMSSKSLPGLEDALTALRNLDKSDKSISESIEKIKNLKTQFSSRQIGEDQATKMLKKFVSEAGDSVQVLLGGEKVDEGEIEKEIFIEYKSVAKIGNKHPAEVVESAGLNSIPLPPATFRDHLEESMPEEIVSKGILSDLQLEGVLHACQTHQRKLPSGERMGFFLADGTGVGKGRQVCGIVLDSFVRGRERALWLSFNADLVVDAERDCRDLGIHKKIPIIKGPKDLKPGKKSTKGLLFCTYATLISTYKENSNKITRLDQIVEFLGGSDAKINPQDEKMYANNYKGVIVFDECHKAKNLVLSKNTEGVETERETVDAKKSTKTALAVIDLQRRLPNARVVYCSATGVTELQNLAYCDRLGLWGQGSNYSHFKEFMTEAQSNGIFFLEMIVFELKRAGCYVSRGLSYKEAEYQIVHKSLTDEQIQMYSAASQIWIKALQLTYFMKEIEDSETIYLGGKKKQFRGLINFFTSHQRFFRNLVLSFKIDLIMEDVKNWLKDGYAIVFGLQTTGEATQKRKKDESNLGSKELFSLCQETLLEYIRKYLDLKDIQSQEEIQILENKENKMEDLNIVEKESVKIPDHFDFYQTFQAERDNNTSIQMSASECVRKVGGIEVARLLFRKLYKDLVDDIENMELPPTALDHLIDSLGGPERVAEMTGRKENMIRVEKKKNKFYFVKRRSDDVAINKVNVEERRLFMEGKKFVAIISDAASTGISLHASKDVKNQKRRIHITLELPWSADKAVQQMGRTHRSHQTSAPIYKLLSTDLGGERRFAAAIAKRLESLGALTKGDRRAASGMNMTEFNIQDKYSGKILKSMFQSIEDGGSSAPSGFNLSKLYEIAFQEPSNELNEESDARRLNKVYKQAMSNIMLDSKSQTKGEPDVALSKFLNRILGLPPSIQNSFYQYFFDVHEVYMEHARKTGKLDVSVRSLYNSGDSVNTLKTEDKFYNNSTLVTELTHKVIEIHRGMTLDKMKEKFRVFQEDNKEEWNDKYSGFYISKKKGVLGVQSCICALRTSGYARDGDFEFYKLGRPYNGFTSSTGEKSRSEILRQFDPVNQDSLTLKNAWNAEYRTSDSTDQINLKKTINTHFVTGSLVQLWKYFPSEQKKFLNRITTSDNKTMVGVNFYRLGDVETLKKRMSEVAKRESGAVVKVHLQYFGSEKRIEQYIKIRYGYITTEMKHAEAFIQPIDNNHYFLTFDISTPSLEIIPFKQKISWNQTSETSFPVDVVEGISCDSILEEEVDPVSKKFEIDYDSESERKNTRDKESDSDESMGDESSVEGEDDDDEEEEEDDDFADEERNKKNKKIYKNNNKNGSKKKKVSDNEEEESDEEVIIKKTTKKKVNKKSAISSGKKKKVEKYLDDYDDSSHISSEDGEPALKSRRVDHDSETSSNIRRNNSRSATRKKKKYIDESEEEDSDFEDDWKKKPLKKKEKLDSDEEYESEQEYGVGVMIDVAKVNVAKVNAKMNIVEMEVDDEDEEIEKGSSAKKRKREEIPEKIQSPPKTSGNVYDDTTVEDISYDSDFIYGKVKKEPFHNEVDMHSDSEGSDGNVSMAVTSASAQY